MFMQTEQKFHLGLLESIIFRCAWNNPYRRLAIKRYHGLVLLSLTWLIAFGVLNPQRWPTTIIYLFFAAPYEVIPNAWILLHRKQPLINLNSICW